MISETPAIGGDVLSQLDSGVYNPREYMRSEEPVNTATHAFGCIAAAAGGAAMLLDGHDAPLGCLITSLLFAAMLSLTYGVSALSHAVQTVERKYLLRAWDQGVIYLLIVGSMTPLLYKFVPVPLMVPVLALSWAAAIAGFVSKVVFRHRIDDTFSPVSYIALGWIPSLALCCYLPWGCLLWIAGGGVLYTVGVIFLRLDARVRYFHAIWHLFVLSASSCHFYAIYRCVLTP